MISLTYNSIIIDQFIIVSDVSEDITKTTTIRINFAKQYVLYNIEAR